MNKFKSIARAFLTLALSTAVLAACDGNQNNGNNGNNGNFGDGNNGNFGNGVNNSAFPNANACGQPVVANGYQPYRAQPYVGNNGFRDGFGGCEPGYFPACGNGFGQTYQAGLMCLPTNRYNMGNVIGYGYNNGAFNYGNVGGLRSCGFGGPCPQIAQTCVIGMPNACAYGACLSVDGTVGVCARQ